LYSRNRKNLEDYVSFYKNYDKWRKYTDWDNDTWYSSHIPPRFIYINSVIRIESFNLFNGYIANIVTKNDDGKIAMQCVESENSGYDYDIPDYFTDIFLEGESYNLDYEIDGDYLYLTVNNQTKITLVRMRPGYSKVLFKFYVNTITEEDYKSIVWPRHADGSCDYDDKIIQNQKTSASYKTTDNLRLRRSEATTSEILTTLKKATKVTVIKFGKQQTIDGITANWVKVKLEDGTEGWCFGGYLVEVPVEMKVPSPAHTEEVKDTTPAENDEKDIPDETGGDITTSPFPLLPVAGGAVLVIVIALVVVIAKRKKR